MVINLNGYKRRVKKYKKEHTYRSEMRIFCEGKENNPALTDAFNLKISNLKEKNPKWGRTSLDCKSSIIRSLFLKLIYNGCKLLN